MKKIFSFVLAMAFLLGGCSPSPKKEDLYLGQRRAFLAQLDKFKGVIELDPKWNKVFCSVDFVPNWDKAGRPNGIETVIVLVCEPFTFQGQAVRGKGTGQFANECSLLAKKMLEEKEIKNVKQVLIYFEDIKAYQVKFEFPSK